MSLADELSRLYAQATRGDAMQSDLEALEREMFPHAPLLIAALRLAEAVDACVTTAEQNPGATAMSFPEWQALKAREIDALAAWRAAGKGGGGKRREALPVLWQPQDFSGRGELPVSKKPPSLVTELIAMVVFMVLVMLFYRGCR